MSPPDLPSWPHGKDGPYLHVFFFSRFWWKAPVRRHETCGSPRRGGVFEEAGPVCAEMFSRPPSSIVPLSPNGGKFVGKFHQSNNQIAAEWVSAVRLLRRRSLQNISAEPPFGAASPDSSIFFPSPNQPIFLFSFLIPGVVCFFLCELSSR